MSVVLSKMRDATAALVNRVSLAAIHYEVLVAVRLLSFTRTGIRST